MAPVLDKAIEADTDRDFVISFVPMNPFSSIRIITKLSEVHECYVTNGLTALNSIDNIRCTAYSNVIEVSRFEMYQRSNKSNKDLISLAINGRVPSTNGSTLPIEIYTYQSEDFVNKIDQDTTDKASSIKVEESPPNQPNTVLTVDNTNPGEFFSITGEIVPLENYQLTNPASLKMVFPPEFKIGKDLFEGPSCFYESFYQYEDGFDIIDVTQADYVECGLNPFSANVLDISLESLGTYIPLLKQDPNKTYLDVYNKITITNLRNPIVSDSYDIEMIVLNEDEIATEKYILTTSITPPSSAVTMLFESMVRNEFSRLTVNFESPLELNPSNRTPSNYYSSFSSIRLKFRQYVNPDILWPFDLGYTNISDRGTFDCSASKDLSAYPQGLKCRLYKGRNPSLYTLANNDFVTVAIENYKTILKSNTVEFSLYVKTPDTGVISPVHFEIYTIERGVEQLILTQTVNPASFNDKGAVPVLDSFSAVAANLEPDSLSNVQISFTTITGITIANQPYIVIYLPVGWTVTSEYLSNTRVFINGLQIFRPNYQYDSYSNAIHIKLSNDLPADAHVINLTNLVTEKGETANNLIKVALYENQVIINESEVDLGAIGCKTITTVNMSTNLIYSDMKGATYEFSWTNSRDYNNTVVEIEFPPSYYTFDTGKQYEVNISLNDKTLDKSKFSVTVNLNGFQIDLGSSLGNHSVSSGTNIKIRTHDIENPSIIVTAENFAVNVYSSTFSPLNGSYSKKLECASFQMPSNFMSITAPNNRYTAKIKDIHTIPSNAGFPITFSAVLDIANFLPKGTFIHLYLSSRFSIVRTNLEIECYGIEGLSLIKSCSTQVNGAENYIRIETAEDYTNEGDIEIKFIGFSVLAMSDDVIIEYFNDFYLETVFDGEIINTSNATMQNEIALYSADYTSNYSSDITLDISPLNEAEIATYSFRVDFTSVGAIEEYQTIWIRFPPEYDLHLSNIPLVATSTLNGALKTAVMFREIFITGFYSQHVSSFFDLAIFGIVNPNRNGDIKTGDFAFAILNQNNDIYFYRDDIPGVKFSSAPSIIQILQKSVSSNIYRNNADYDFLLTSAKPFASSADGGLIKVLYPQDFIMDVFLSNCSTQDNFSLYSSCGVSNNLITVVSSNDEFDTSISGALKLQVYNLRNAENFGRSGNIIIYNFDSRDKLVLSRSYPNISTSYFTFEQDRLEISVNDDNPIYLEVGSFSGEIEIRAHEPFKQRLNILPLYFDTKFLFDRNPILLIKDTDKAVFRLAAPQNMLVKTFYITWSTTGDSVIKYYSTLRKTPVVITKGVLFRYIDIESTLYANRDGMSIPIVVSTPNPPYSQVVIDISIINDTGLVELSDTSVKLNRGQYAASFYIKHINQDYREDFIELSFSLTGEDATSFILNTTSLKIQVNPRDIEPPIITSMELVDINRSSANILIKADKLAYIYCAYGHKVN